MLAERAAPDCRVCLVPHDDATHEATVSVHAYLRARIARILAEPVPPVRWTGGDPPKLPAVEEVPVSVTRKVQPRKRPDVTVELVRELLLLGLTKEDIARRLGCGTHLVRLRLKEAR